MLPLAPSPYTPPWPGSPATRKGWFKSRVTPPNPFEEANKDISRKARQKASKNPANQSGAISEALSSDERAPSETPPCEDPPPPSAQTDGSAASSPGAGESSQDNPGEPPATAAGLPEGLGETPSRLADGDNPLGSVELPGGGAMGGVADMAVRLGDLDSSVPAISSDLKEGQTSPSQSQGTDEC